MFWIIVIYHYNSSSINPSSIIRPVNKMQLKFGGTQRLYSQTGFDNLNRSCVTIVGIGGVGSWVAEALARTAIGKMILIDLDDLCITNTNRQIHATDDNVGRLKVEVMAERIKLINRNCQVIPVVDFISKDNLAEHIDNNTDYVVDAIDNARTKAALIAYCKRQKIKILTIGGAGGQKDPLKITLGDLSRSWQDPLSAKVRSELRSNYRFSKNPKRRFGVECVYSTEQLIYPKANGGVSLEKQSRAGSARLDCAQGFGAAVTVTATFGMIAAARIINKLSES